MKASCYQTTCPKNPWLIKEPGGKHPNYGFFWSLQVPQVCMTILLLISPYSDTVLKVIPNDWNPVLDSGVAMEDFIDDVLHSYLFVPNN
jgi:hypothetical protein